MIFLTYLGTVLYQCHFKFGKIALLFLKLRKISPIYQVLDLGKSSTNIKNQTELHHLLLTYMHACAFMIPYKNEKVAARLQLGCCYNAAIKYVCNSCWRQSSQLERLVACLQQPCSFYQRLQAHRATTRSQLQLAAVTSKKTARTHSL